MRIRLYLDEDRMSRAVLLGLRTRGVDVTSTTEEGNQRLADAGQLAFAAARGRVIYTANISDFYRLHSEWLAIGKTHAGIILAPQRRFTAGDQLRRLLLLISKVPAESMIDQCEFLTDWGS